MRKIIQFLLISFLLMICESGLRNLEHPPFKLERVLGLFNSGIATR